MHMSSKDEPFAKWGEITPKEKSPTKALFLLSVLAKKFSPIPTCHSPKRNDRLDSEECEASAKEFSHKMRGLRNNS